jgi:hypothetical protein
MKNDPINKAIESLGEFASTFSTSYGWLGILAIILFWSIEWLYKTSGPLIRTLWGRHKDTILQTQSVFPLLITLFIGTTTILYCMGIYKFEMEDVFFHNRNGFLYSPTKKGFFGHGEVPTLSLPGSPPLAPPIAVVVILAYLMLWDRRGELIGDCGWRLMAVNRDGKESLVCEDVELEKTKTIIFGTASIALCSFLYTYRISVGISEASSTVF